MFEIIDVKREFLNKTETKHKGIKIEIKMKMKLILKWNEIENETTLKLK